MKTSETINELATALSKAQSAFETAARDHKAKVETRTGGSYEFSYADFASYLEVCRKPLGDNGLSFIQEGVYHEGAAKVTTRLLHSSGQWVETEPLLLPLIADSRGAITPQIVGSGLTYGKRYSLSSLIGMASEADDDGNAASGNTADIGRREPREALPPCPKCGETKGVIVGKAEYGGGLVCFAKKGGCGHKWQPGDEAAKPDMTVHDQLTAKDQLVIAQVVTMFGETQNNQEFMAVCDLIKTTDSVVNKSDHPELVKEQIRKAIKGHPNAPKSKGKKQVEDGGPEFVPEDSQAA